MCVRVLSNDVLASTRDIRQNLKGLQPSFACEDLVFVLDLLSIHTLERYQPRQTTPGYVSRHGCQLESRMPSLLAKDPLCRG